MEMFPMRHSPEESDYWEGVGVEPLNARIAYQHESEIGMDCYFRIPIEKIQEVVSLYREITQNSINWVLESLMPLFQKQDLKIKQ